MLGVSVRGMVAVVMGPEGVGPEPSLQRDVQIKWEIFATDPLLFDDTFKRADIYKNTMYQLQCVC
jgi:hypothetical protein